jgi:hypothetical protein
MRSVKAVKALPGYRLWVRFDDGVEGTADVADLAGHGVFALWNEPGRFEQIRVGEFGELVWSEQVDFSPDALSQRVTGQTPEQMFPNLLAEARHA